MRKNASADGKHLTIKSVSLYHLLGDYKGEIRRQWFYLAGASSHLTRRNAGCEKLRASQISFIEVSKVERMKGTFTATLTGMTRDIRPRWKRELGKFALWLARVCGESQYVIDNRIPVDYEISADGEVKINLSGTSIETTMTLTGIPEHLKPPESA